MPDEIKNIKTYRKKEHMILSRSIRRRRKKPIRPELPAGFLEKLKQMRYSDHTIRVYTTYIGDFQQYFAGSNLKRISPDEINAYLLHLIDKKNISSCQQNQCINAIKFYSEAIFGEYVDFEDCDLSTCIPPKGKTFEELLFQSEYYPNRLGTGSKNR